MINKDKKICIAICNYNHSQYLKQSINSIVSQSYENLDIAIVDDGSKNQHDVDEIISSFNDKRIRYIRLLKNTGKWNALNLAFSTTDAEICTSHDADDVSLPWRIDSQYEVMVETKTVHNLCGFISCWEQEQMSSMQNEYSIKPQNLNLATGEAICNAVMMGFKAPHINHYFTGNFETAGVSAMFYKTIWDCGFRFNPPGLNLRTLLSEDSDFNFRVTAALRSTSLLLEKPYLYRRNTSTNKEEI